MQTHFPDSVSRRPESEDETARKAYVRDWIAQRLTAGKTAGTGLVGALLTLPALAAAQGREGFVDATEIEGVQAVEVRPDGSVHMQMSNGVTVSVPAQDVQLGANGEVLVSERIVEIAGEVMASGGAAAGMGGAGLAGGAAAAAIAGAAAASDDDGGGAGGPELTTVNSQVLSDGGGLTNANTEVDASEEAESVEVTVTGEDGNEVPLSVTLGEDGSWTADPDEGSELPQGEVTVTVRSLDADGEEIDSTEQTVIIDTIPPTIEVTDTGVGDDGFLNIAEQGEGITISGTTDAEDGQDVTVTLSAGSGDPTEATATVSGGEWSVDIAPDDLAGISDGDEVTVEATVSDAAGNEAERPATATFEADLAGPSIDIDTISDDGQIGLIDVQDDLLVTGSTTAEVGQAVTLTFNGEEYTGEVVSNGLEDGGAAWEVTVPQSALAALQDEAGDDGQLSDVEVSATVRDAAGNPASSPAVTTIDADFTGPSIAIDPIAGDDVVNIAESEADVTISGTTNNVGAGQTVTVTVDGESLDTTDTGDDGSWSVTLPQAAVADLQDGESVEVAAEVADADGVPAETTTQLAADFTAPTVEIDPVAGDDVINAEEAEAPLTISGTATDATGQTVTVGLPGLSDPTAEIGDDGTWSLELTQEQTEDLAETGDGGPIDITANVSDAAGNPADEATRPVEVDLTPPEVSIEALPLDGDVLNIAESEDDLEISGTASETDEVTVTLDGTEQAPVSVAADGTWSTTIAAATLQDLPDGTTVEVSATGTDTAGNIGQATVSFDTDLTAPSLTIDGVSAGDTLTLGELEDGLTVTGTASPDAAGNDVTLTIDGEDFTGTVDSEGDWTVELTETELRDLDLADETGFDLTANVADAAGNTATPQTRTLTTDFQPVLTLDPIGEDGALDLSDTGSTAITGTALGIEDGQDVTVVGTASGSEILNETATVGADGTWALDVPQATFDALEAGETVQIEANAQNTAGRAAEAATAAVDVYLESAFTVINTATSGTTLTMSALAGESLDSNVGVETTMTFDPAEAAYVSGSDDNNFDLFIVNDEDASTGSVTFAGGTAASQLAEDDVMYRFDMTDEGAGPIILGFEDEEQGGPTELQIGTSEADTLTAGNTDAALQGKGGDDTLDIAATGANIVVFETDVAANGTDTVTGFTTGDTLQADAIAFAGEADLRGAGETVEALADGGALGDDTGFVVFTTALDDTDAATLETAFEDLTGEAAGDTVYFLAGDGTDATLVRAEVGGADDATVEVMAEFEDIGDLGDLRTDNITLPDPVMNS